MRPSIPDPAELLAEASRVRALARRLAAVGEEHEDLAQDALAAALASPRRPAGPLRPWLAGVVRKRLAFLRRSDARRRAREHAAARAEALPDASELAEASEVRARLAQALAELREPGRSVLLLRFLADLSPAEIARRRGVPAATVRSQIRRGLQELRAELDGAFQGDRRRAQRALLLVALPSSPVGPAAGKPLHLLRRARAMHPATQILLAGAAAVAAGLLLHADLRPGAAIGPAASPPAATHARAEPKAPSAAAGRSAIAPATSQAGGPAPISGVVRDAGGAALRGFQVILRHEDVEDGELLWTDDEGRFTSAGSYGAGTVRFTLVDHPDLRVLQRLGRRIQRAGSVVGIGRDWTPEKGPLALRTQVGPTFALALSGAQVDPTELVARLEAVEDEPWGALASSSILEAPVRAGDPPWVRFPHVQMAAQRPWRLCVARVDGLVAGEREVALDAPTADPVPLALAPRARLAVILAGANALEDPTLAVEAVASGARRALLPTFAQGGPDFARGGLQAGSYRLLLGVDDQDLFAGALELEAGAATDHALDLSAFASSSRVEGELRSQSGAFREPTTLAVLDADGEALHLEPAKWIQSQGQWRAPFAIDNLPLRTLELRILSKGSHRRWDPLPLQVVPPQAGLALVRRDAEPVHEVRVQIVAAATGEDLATGVASLALTGCEQSQVLIGAGGLRLFSSVPLDALEEWHAAAPGFAPRWGGAGDLVPVGERFELEVPLHPGWGARVRAVRSGTLPAEPLAGVQVLLDGAPVGVTDAQGELALAQPAAPAAIDAVLEGWSCVGGDLGLAPEHWGLAPWRLLRFAPQQAGG